MTVASTLRRVCIHWPRFGPLHLNRLHSAYDALQAEGIELVAIEASSTDSIYAWREERDPTPYERITLFPGAVYDELNAARLFDRMTATLDGLRPDAVLIHSYATPDAQAALAWCRRRRRIAVCMAESKEDDGPRVGWRELVKRVLVSQFDAAQAAGTRAADYIAQLGLPPDRIFFGYSVVNNAYFAEQAAEARRQPEAARHLPGLSDPTPFFLASNRFVERKNLPLLLRSYAAYRRRVPSPWRLVMLGDGVLRGELEALVERRGIEGVVFAGFRQIDELPAYYAHASAFVHPASIDQWGLVVNEAMAAGLPVIVSSGAGCSTDLVEEGCNGFTFAPADGAALTRHMAAISEEVDLAAFSQCSREIISRFPLKRFGTSLVEAVRAGAPHADHGLPPHAAALLWMMRSWSRTPRSFNRVQT